MSRRAVSVRDRRPGLGKRVEVRRRALPSREHEEAAVYIINPALAGIVGASRERTVLITSVLSIPCR
jgi:hypothetical protein